MPNNFFPKEEQQQIISAIQEAEKNTSGEIRLHVDKFCKGDVLDKAAYWFEKLKMHQTKLRNGVLFYIAVADKKFAILGDAGINQKVPDDFWEQVKSATIESFKQGKYAEGLSKGILECGKQLKAHFPYQEDDVNELPDDISFGNQ